MKMKYFLATAVLALLFAGCSKDVTPFEGDDDSGIVTDPTGSGWVSFNIGTPTSAFNTKGLNDPNVITGTEGETTVTEFYVLLFDSDEKLTYKDLIDNTDGRFGKPNQPQGQAGEAFKVPATSKRVLIVANPSAKFKTVVNGAAETTLYSAINSVISDEDLAAVSTNNHFMMTNAKGGLEPSYLEETVVNEGGTPVTYPKGADKDLVLYTSKDRAEASPLSINIDRVVVKVRVYLTPADGTDLSEYANIYNAGWLLNVTNKKVFPVSKRDSTWNERFNNKVNGARGTYITPFDQYRIGSYRIDPNYGTTQPDRATAVNGDGTVNTTGAYYANYNWLERYPDPDNTTGGWNAVSVGSWSTSQQFCFENTQTQPDNIWAYTTQVILKAEFAPKGLRVPTLVNDAVEAGGLYTESGKVTDGNVLEGTDWIMVSEAYGYNGFYTWNLLMQWIEAELRYKYLYDAGDQTPLGINNLTLCNALAAYIGKIEDATPTVPKTAEQFASAIMSQITDGEYQNEKTQAEIDTYVNGKVTAALALFTAKESVVTTKGSYQYGQVTYYKGGVNYYPIMIKHDDTEAATNEYGEFGVVRNSVYDIMVQKVNKPGYPYVPQPTPNPEDPDDPDPGKEPDEDDDNYLSIKINVNPWTWYKQIVEF